MSFFIFSNGYKGDLIVSEIYMLRKFVLHHYFNGYKQGLIILIFILFLKNCYKLLQLFTQVENLCFFFVAFLKKQSIF